MKTLYQEKGEIFTMYHIPQSDDYLEYQTLIQIKDSGKQPVTMKFKFTGLPPSFAPMPPEKHVLKAKDLPELFLKLNRWVSKYGYEFK